MILTHSTTNGVGRPPKPPLWPNQWICPNLTPFKGPVPHPSRGVSKGTSYLFSLPPSYYSMSPNKALPEFLVQPLINFYWLKSPRTWVDNKPISLIILLTMSIEKIPFLCFLFLNWRNFKCGSRLIEHLLISFLLGKKNRKKFSYQFNTLLTYRTPGVTRQFPSSELHNCVVLSWSCLSLSLLKAEKHQWQLKHQVLERQTCKITALWTSAFKRLTFFG